MNIPSTRFVAGGAFLVLTFVVACESATPPGDTTSPSVRFAVTPQPVVNVGGTADFYAVIALNDSATFEVSGAPVGVTITSGELQYVAGKKVQRLTVRAEDNAPTGEFSVTLTGSSAGGTRAVTVPLIVQQAPPLTPIAFRFCAFGAQVGNPRFLYQNEGGPWTSIVRDPDGYFRFSATPRVAFALSTASANTGDAVIFMAFYYLTAQELERSDCAVTRGSKQLFVPVANAMPSGVVQLFGRLSVTDIALARDALPPGGARRRTVVIRRNVAGNFGDTLAPFDYLGAEAVPVDSVSLSAPVSACDVSLRMKGETNGLTSASTFLFAVPSSALQANDVHFASCGNSSASKLMQFVYRNLSGPMTVAIPDPSAQLSITVDTIGGRLLYLRVGIDATYPDMISAGFSRTVQPTPSPHFVTTHVGIWTSRGFQRPGATTWLVPFPVIITGSAVDNVGPFSTPPSVGLRHYSGNPSLYLGGKGEDGDLVRSALVTKTIGTP